MVVRTSKLGLWSAAAVALVAASPVPETRVKIETLTCRAFAAELAAFEAAHPGVPRAEMPTYKALIAAAQARTNTTGNEREVAAAIDDMLVDCAAQPDTLVLDLLKHHRIVGDRWRE